VRILSSSTKEVGRYIANGLVATAIHYAILTLNLEVLHFKSAAIANVLAAATGIIASFLGSRYFVFKNTKEDIASQAVKFGAMYGFIALIHGLVMFVWADKLGLDYRIGFLVATIMQVSLSYFGNKFLVFKS
jgi:putative flippase GtrA